LSNKLEVRLLGKFDVRRDGKPIAITSRPAQSLFAYLILSIGTSHRREKLAGMLWPDSLEETARDNLRHALWRMRKALESASSTRFLHADDVTVGLKESSDYWLDAAELEKVRENASADELIAVLSDYQGELLPGFYDEWVILEREHLYSIFEHHMARLMSLLQTENRWLDILEWSERWIKLGQKPEPAYRALMSAHAAKGDMSKVPATYERCVKSLREFGIEPSEQTKELYQNLKSGKETPETTHISTKLAAKEISSNIPVPLTSFVGREKELQEIARLLTSSRLLTLTGPGGVGKTRLAIQTAHTSTKKFKDGVFWVGLVGLSDENLIPQEIAQSLGVREVANEPLIETLKAHLKSKVILLVIDNCEHLIRACAQHVEQLLAACPRLKIMATSIEALSLFNEVIWQVPSLPLPDTQASNSFEELQEFASIKLFDERASTVKAGFALDQKNIISIAQICNRLDGIPLAIELAAARIKVLSVDEIAARLDDRFSLLTAGSRTAIPRHQTLRATIDWSYDLLTDPERVLLRRLSVFAGGFTLEAAEAVCSQGMKRSDILDLLGHLVDKSLVIVEADVEKGDTRYRLLETIRQYALEKLVQIGETPITRDQHLAFYLDLAERSEPYIFSSESAIWVSRLDKELDNIRAAMDWSTSSGKAVVALQIAGSLMYFWWTHGFLTSEWHDRIQRALALPEGRERTLARAKALNGIGSSYWADANPTDRRPQLEEALSIGRELGDRWNIATALRNLGVLNNIRGNYSEARVFLEQGLEIWRGMGAEGKQGYAICLAFLGDVVLNCSQAENARLLYDESVMVLKEPEIGDNNFLGYPTRRLGQLAWREGNYENAVALCKESLRLNYEISDPRGVMCCVAGFGAIAVARGKFEDATKLLAAVETQLATIGVELWYMDKMEYERNLALVRAKLDEKTFAKFWAKGKMMSFEEAIAFALEEAEI
jgi:predicted ATPase/DNA-binding SARP family transcriptional activator